MGITMQTNILEELINNRGFVMKENGALEYGAGSISNYKLLKVFQPRMHCSLAKGEELVMACYVEYEDFSSPGYIECDWKHREEGYVAEENLLAYLDSKGIYNREERRKRWEEIKSRRATR